MRRSGLIVVLVTLWAHGLGATSPPNVAIAIQNAHIVPVSGPEIANGTVLFAKGIIQDVGPTVTIPPGAWVIDGTGLTVYPGFIDGLSTWGIPPAPAPRDGATPAAESRSHGPEDRPQTYSYERAADLVKPSDRRLESVRAAGFTSAATFPNRGIFEGLGALVDLAGERGRDMVVASPIGQQIVFRTGSSRAGFPGSLMGNISYVRQLFLDLDQYQSAFALYNASPTGKRRPEYDHTLEGLAQSPRLLLPATQKQQIDRMLSFGPELKKPFVLYDLHEAYERVAQLKQAGVPLLVSLKWPAKPKDADPSEAGAYRDLLMRDKAPSVPGLLAKEGIHFGFYSDGIESAPDLKKAIKKAIDSGLTLPDAIRALTLSVAEIYGLDDRLGSIQKGKIANLVVTKGEAFDDKTTVEYVFIDGEQFEPSKELQQPSTPKPPTALEEAGNDGNF